jgi:hypothetical protein
VKTHRSIPETDLANIAPLPRDQKRRALEALKIVTFVRYSYRPVRLCTLDTFGIDAGPLSAGATTTLPQLLSHIRSLCTRGDEEYLANIRVGEGLFNWAQEKEITGRRLDIYPFALGVADKVTYWSQVVVGIDRRPCIPFIDPRRSPKLTRAGRKFVHSVMHERIRVADPDLADVGLAIIQFENTEKGPRRPVVHLEEETLFTYDELAEMTRETYVIWHEILEERDEETRRRAAGVKGTLI